MSSSDRVTHFPGECELDPMWDGHNCNELADHLVERYPGAFHVGPDGDGSTCLLSRDTLNVSVISEPIDRRHDAPELLLVTPEGLFVLGYPRPYCHSNKQHGIDSDAWCRYIRTKGPLKIAAAISRDETSSDYTVTRMDLEDQSHRALLYGYQQYLEYKKDRRGW